MAAPPSVDVVIINHGYGRYLGAAIRSALEQTLPPARVVVVDDGSTDDSRAVIASFGAAVLPVLTANHGAMAATGAGVSRTTADVVALLDSDDLMLPARVQRLTGAYAARPDAGWVFHQLEHVDRETLEPTGTTPVQRGFRAGPVDARASVRAGRLPMTMPATSALSFRRDLLAGLFPTPPGIRAHDNYLKFRALGLAPGFVLEEVLSRQGLHGDNVYTRSQGPARRAFRAESVVAMLPGFAAAGPDLDALSRRFAADALADSGFGRRLPRDSRRQLRGYLRTLPASRRAAVVSRAVALRGRDLVRR